ncbi:MAG: mechanosensitive ion channel family protein [Candidatus Korobacteraceae bacterium]
MPFADSFFLMAQGLWADVYAHAYWITPVLLLGGGLLLGLIVDRVVLRYLRKIAERTPWEADDVVLRAVRNMPVYWFFLAGAWAALNHAAFYLPRWEGMLRRTLLVLFLFSLTLAAARVASGLVALYSLKSEGLIQSTSIFRNLTVVFVFVLGILVILDSLGVSITPILTALGVGGLAVALALQDTLSNLFAGIQIIASRQVRVGDYIRLDSGQEGYVTDIRWRNTTIRALANNMIIVPNSKLASAITTNFYQPEREMGFGVPCSVAYGSDLERVERVTIEVARQLMQEFEGGVPTADPGVRFNGFGNSAITFNVLLRCREFVDQYMLTHEFIKRLHLRYQQEEIEIPFPIQTVYLKGEQALDSSSPGSGEVPAQKPPVGGRA